MNYLINRPTTFCAFLVAETEPIHASSADYGFDFDKEEIALELLDPLPVSLSMQVIPEMEADEFERAFHYILA